MVFKYNLKTAFSGLRTNKSRSLLTILGIVIGITAIIMVMSIGQGAKDLILNQIKGLGSRTIIIQPGREPQGPSDVSAIFSDSLKDREFEALKNKSNVPGIAEVSPIVLVAGGTTVSYEGETVQATTVGASDLMARIMDMYPEEGIFFSEEEIKSQASVAVIGAEVKKKLFGSSEALGQKIKIKNRNFKIVGILPRKGQTSIFNADEMIAIPYTTAQRYLTGTNYYQELIVQAESEESVPRVVEDIKITLRNLHNITDPEKDDFHVTTQEDIASRVSVITGTLTLLLVSVATISLVVGGIGIMNIMLVSVTERTREIGLRKAIGATEKNILTQFLFEAVTLTLVGGIVGIIAGAFFSFLVALVLSKTVSSDWSFAFPVSAALIGFAVSGFVGVAFGIYPARKAASKNPIDALRYE